MTHQQVREWLSAQRDGELHGVDDAIVRDHLRTCAACRDHQLALDRLSAVLGALPRVEPPAALAERTLARIAGEKRARRPRGRVVLPVAFVAVAAAVMVGLLPTPPAPLDIVSRATLPAGAAAAPLTDVRSLYVERVVVETPDGDPARRRTVAERVWWAAPDRLRIERDVTDATGRRSTELVVRAGDHGLDVVDGRRTSYRAGAPDLAHLPEPLSTTIGFLGRPQGPGPTVAGRPTTRYEVVLAGVRRVALVDAARYIALGGDDRLILGKQQLVDGILVATRTVRRVDVNPPVDPARFAVPVGRESVDRGFRERPVDSLPAVRPVAAPRGFRVARSGADATGSALLYQRGAFPILVTSAVPDTQEPLELETVTVGSRPAFVRVPLYGYPSISFSYRGAQITLTAPLPANQLAQLAQRMYYPAE
ncbi:MAG TPA: zf-HC2 domain-containing protein [Mycobacteriales bacterium]|nr:zf-HC2 domain-containing protein [Mycobacteriales bacterium]